jgi:hypothetical protein
LYLAKNDKMRGKRNMVTAQRPQQSTVMQTKENMKNECGKARGL